MNKQENFLYGWSKDDLDYLTNTSLFKCINDSRQFGLDIYKQIFIPFVEANVELFGNKNKITFEQFVTVCNVVSSRTFGEDEYQEFIPVFDLINGKPNRKHNCTLDYIMINNCQYRTLKTLRPIYAGQEIFLEYAQCGNGDYLIAYNHIPCDIDVIARNIYTEISLDMNKFFNDILTQLHPQSPDFRSVIKTYISTVTGVPHNLVMSLDDLRNSEMNIPQSMKQVLIFLHSDQESLKLTIQTKRIKKMSVQPHILFQSLYYLIETQYPKPNLNIYKELVTNPNLNDNVKSAIFLQMSERIVIEKFINCFIDLFDDFQLPVALSIFGSHMITTEIMEILNELVKPEELLKTQICMMCGSTQRIVRCSRCHDAFYCGSKCQEEHWKIGHKQQCKKINFTTIDKEKDKEKEKITMLHE
jgi:hypothetical protein